MCIFILLHTSYTFSSLKALKSEGLIGKVMQLRKHKNVFTLQTDIFYQKILIKVSELKISMAQYFTSLHYLSRLVGKPTIWFPNGSDSNQAVQSQKQARRLKFQI